MKVLIAILLALCAARPAFAIGYPVSGAWGKSGSGSPGAIDCAARRIVKFAGERRFDSAGAIPEFRIRSITAEGASAFRITEEFNTGQINARLTYTLRQTGANHIELVMSPGGTLKLQRCR